MRIVLHRATSSDDDVEDEPVETVEIDLEGFEARAVQLPIAAGYLGNLEVNDKGQLLCNVAAARAHLRANECLPLNLTFLFEGEEETGSANKFVC